jgi:vancomycin permeability regulator SanA
LKKLLAVAAAIALLGALAVAWVGLSAKPGDADAALVFGNTVERTGAPSRRLEARLDAARRLYAGGRVRLILVSGGFGKEGFDEADVMARWLRARGVPTPR